MVDIMERLRKLACPISGDEFITAKDAADEIEKLRAALRDIIADSYSVYAIQVARAALGNMEGK